MDMPSSVPKASEGRQLMLRVCSFVATVLKDVLFFLVLATLVLLVLFTIVNAMGDMAKLQKASRLRHANSHLKIENRTLVRKLPTDCYWPASWCRVLYNCNGKLRHRKLIRPRIATPLPTELMPDPDLAPGPQLPNDFEQISNTENFMETVD